MEQYPPECRALYKDKFPFHFKKDYFSRETEVYFKRIAQNVSLFPCMRRKYLCILLFFVKKKK